MNFNIMFLLSLSVILPAVIGTFKLRVSDKVLPLVIVFYFGVITTLLFYFLKAPFLKNTFSNIYVLFDYCLLLLQLRYWGSFSKKHSIEVLIIVGIMAWVLTTVFFGLGFRNSAFRIFSSFFIAICSIDLINRIAFERILLLKDYRFLFAVGFIVFHTYNILVESLMLVSNHFTDTLTLNIFMIKNYIDVGTNLLYSYAFLCLAKKRTFTML